MFRFDVTRAATRWRLVARAGLVVAALAVAGGMFVPLSGWTAGPQVEIKAHEYSPATITVAPGTEVTWINHDEDVHTVTSTTDVFHSVGIDTDETFSYTFTQPGTYEYFCKLHPLMTARVVVK
jgi:plastocyanin